MFCPKCGSTLPENVPTCPSCGKSLQRVQGNRLTVALAALVILIATGVAMMFLAQ